MATILVSVVVAVVIVLVGVFVMGTSDWKDGEDDFRPGSRT